MNPTYTVSRTARIEAPADRIYDIIRDYHHGHPSILPKQFSNMRVEEGGVGAGTRIGFDVTVLGQTQHFIALVTEPEPGRVLVEKNVEPTESVTTFVVDPDSGGRAANVTIRTELSSRRGLAGRVERYMTAKVLQSMYLAELNTLAERAALTAPSSSSPPPHP
ncbi:MAG TPA: SRPBCC family protein [Vicinamibacterales bacterium]|nr:SRPBCC family protein [Vicinamibacterales bacterium]